MIPDPSGLVIEHDVPFPTGGRAPGFVCVVVETVCPFCGLTVWARRRRWADDLPTTVRRWCGRCDREAGDGR